MMLTLLRKFRLVRYIRPVKHFVLSLLSSKKEVIRLVVLILFLICTFGPLMLILDSPMLPDCSQREAIPSSLRCIRTLTDATYYLLLIISTVGSVSDRAIWNDDHRSAFAVMVKSIRCLLSLASYRCSFHHFQSWCFQCHYRLSTVNIPRSVKIIKHKLFFLNIFITRSMIVSERRVNMHGINGIPSLTWRNESIAPWNILAWIDDYPTILSRRTLH